jgi:hypothetical protein
MTVVFIILNSQYWTGQNPRQRYSMEELGEVCRKCDSFSRDMKNTFE